MYTGVHVEAKYRNFTCKIMKQAQLKHPMVIIREPLTELCRLVPPLPFWLLFLPFVQNNSSIGPFTRVMIIAPPTVANVPNILAWLRMFLILTFSSLQLKNHKQIGTSLAYGCKYSLFVVT